jgi:hypothetical protein
MTPGSSTGEPGEAIGMLTAGKDGRVTPSPGALGDVVAAAGLGPIPVDALGAAVAAAEQAATRHARRTMNTSGPLMGLAMACPPG